MTAPGFSLIAEVRRWRAAMRIWIALMMLISCVGIAPLLHAQTLVGTWQATAGNLKVVLKVTKQARGTLRGEIYYVGQEFAGNTRSGNPISSIKIDGGKVTFDLDESPGSFDGSLAADGKSLIGNWTGRGEPRPFRFDRATNETAWVIDPSPHKVTFVPVEKDVR